MSRLETINNDQECSAAMKHNGCVSELVQCAYIDLVGKGKLEIDEYRSVLQAANQICLRSNLSSLSGRLISPEIIKSVQTLTRQ